MPPFAKPALAAVAIVALGSVGLSLVRGPNISPAASPLASPSGSPSVSPSFSPALPPPLTQRFYSTLNRISIDYPAGWRVRPATEPWTDGVLSFGAPGVDVIFDPTQGEDLYLAMASEALGGRSEDSWRGTLTLPDCPGGHGGSVLTFDGATGWVTTCGSGPGHQSAVLATKTHGYAVVLYLGSRALFEAYGWDWFKSVLDSMDLRAEADASSPSAAP